MSVKALATDDVPDFAMCSVAATPATFGEPTLRSDSETKSRAETKVALTMGETSTSAIFWLVFAVIS